MLLTRETLRDWATMWWQVGLATFWAYLALQLEPRLAGLWVLLVGVAGAYATTWVFVLLRHGWRAARSLTWEVDSKETRRLRNSVVTYKDKRLRGLRL